MTFSAGSIFIFFGDSFSFFAMFLVLQLLSTAFSTLSSVELRLTIPSWVC